MKARVVRGKDAIRGDSPRGGPHGESALSARSEADPGTAQRVVDVSLRALFALVALLLLADLHSSYLAVHGQWEANPFLAALADQIGTHGALLCAKVADLAMLAGLYALWRRSKAHVAVTLVLVVSTFEYAQIVVNNYQG